MLPTMRASPRASLLPLLVILLSGPTVAGEAWPQDSASVGRSSLFAIGSTADDRLRALQILGRAPTTGYLLRSASALTPELEPDSTLRLRSALVFPSAQLAWNSQIPFSLNDGSSWAGRGATLQVTGGARVELGPLSLTLAPRLSYVQNRDFPLVPGEHPDYSVYLAPWRRAGLSADLPMRFGTDPFTQYDWGQSTLALRVQSVSVGLTTEDQWWGPGVRNAIVLSSNAPGIPRVFLRTSAPLRGRIGEVEAYWMLGALTESLYFDRLPENDLRSINGFALSLQPALEPNLTIGLARNVVEAARDGQAVARHAFSAVQNASGSEQILSLFARWIFPADGLEAYVEWAHHEPPALRDLLLSPERTQGYTLGLQWVKPLGDSASSSLLRLQTEATNLEQSILGNDPLKARYFYTSDAAPHGYTHRGQVIGAAIGPGASSQWLAVDYLPLRWRAGLYVGRIRWDNDAFYTQPSGWSFIAHDVSVLLGARGGVRVGPADVFAELTRETRLNFLYQNPSTTFASEQAVDVRNWAFRLGVTPFR